MIVMKARDDLQVAFFTVFQPSLAIDHPGIFADRHAIDYRYAIHTHEGDEFFLQHRTVNITSS